MVEFEAENIYFLGIGGIGMSALARYFQARKKNVFGYDKTSTVLTDELIAEGINIHFDDDVDQIPISVLKDPKTLIIYTPAIPPTHSERMYLQNQNRKLYKRSEILGLLTANTFTIAVAGTHGKTTTSSIVAHLLTQGDFNCTAFLGGITKNYNSNLLIGDITKGKEYIVVEADEYDRSFLALYPDVTVVTSMDADHLDIYGNQDYMKDSYRLFVSQLKKDGLLIYKNNLPLSDLVVRKKTYGLTDDCNIRVQSVKIADHNYTFDWAEGETILKGLKSEMPGMHNVENATAAIAVSLSLGMDPEKVKSALRNYTGVKRRFDYQIRSENCVFIDDYAHHPEELRACISSVRELYPGRHLTGIFQPHLYSRTRDFADGFAEVLSMLDTLFLLDIYPARELPIDGVSSEMIFSKVRCNDKILCSKNEVLQLIKLKNTDVVLTLGAGDIDQIISPLREYLQSLKLNNHESKH